MSILYLPLRYTLVASPMPSHRISLSPTTSPDSLPPFLTDTFPNTWLSGFRSILVDGFYYPLFGERLLEDIGILLRKYERWLDCVEFLDEIEWSLTVSAAEASTVEECRTCLEVIPYNSTVPALDDKLQLPTQDLALFLSNEWLNDDMINSGSDWIQRRLPPTSRIYFADCLLPDILHRDARVRAPRTVKEGLLWAKQKHLRDSVDQPGFQANTMKLAAFRAKILTDDPYTEFDDSINPRWIRCSSCGSSVVMRAVYDILHSQFVGHVLPALVIRTAIAAAHSRPC